MRRALLVVADQVRRDYLSSLLQGFGLETETAVNGLAALEKARSTPPHLVLSDFFTFVTATDVLVRVWKLDPTLRNIPFVAVGPASKTAGDDKIAADLGADLFIAGECESGEVAAAICQLLDSAGIKNGPEKRSVSAEIPLANRSLQKDLSDRLELAESIASVLDALPAEIALIDSEGVIRRVNEAWRRFARENGLISPAAGLGQNYLTICDETLGEAADVASEVAAGIRSVIRRQNANFVLEYPCDSPQERRWFRVMVTPHSNWSGGAVVMHVDISENKLSEKRLRESHEQNLLLLNSTAEGIFGIDEKGICTFANAAAARMLGHNHPDDMSGKEVHGLHHHTRPDGSPYPPFECRICEAFRLQQNIHCDDERFFRLDGASFPVEYWAYLIRSGDKITGAVVTFHDITKRRELEAKLLRSQRLEAIGQITGGVAHDFNNLLTVVMGNSELMLERTADGPPELRRIAEMTAKAAKRGAELTQRLLAFGRKQALNPKAVDLDALVRSMRELLRRTLGEQIQIETVANPGLWRARVDPGQLGNVLLNLALNSRDAMPSGGRISIHTENVSIDQDYADRHSEISPGDYVRISVTDSGTGISPDIIGKVFEPFFSTKSKAMPLASACL